MNPRRDVWTDHFTWRSDYLSVVDLTAIGSATVNQLRLNRDVYRHQRGLLRAAMAGGAPAWP